MNDRQPPQDLNAEMSLLGAMLLAHDVIPGVVDTFGDQARGVFYKPAHQLIYDTIVGLCRDGEPADAVTVAAALHRRKHLIRVGGAPYLHTLISTVPTAANAVYYAEIVAEKATMRRLVEAGTRIVQLGYSEATGEDVEEVVAQAQRAVDEATRGALTASEFEVLTLAELLAEPERPEDWIVPRLLERGDRLIVTGWEGLGKSEYVAQCALAIAAGLHPFTGWPIAKGETMRVLIIDAENTRRQLRRRLARISSTMNDLRKASGLDQVNWRDAVHIVSRPDGIDLSRPGDVARVERALEATRPDLLVAGPLYKMAGYNTREEEGALKLLQTLDRWRITYNCALISEAHSGHAQAGQPRSTRPRGSAVFLGWPEFGLGLVPHPDLNPPYEHASRVEVTRWRGSREIRDWPFELRHGGRGRLPWVPTDEYLDILSQHTKGV